MKTIRVEKTPNATNTAYFDREQVWAELSDGERLRIKETLALLPHDVSTVLNVGCGDGRVTRGIAKDFEIIGVDLSMTAVSLFHGPALLGSIDALPIKDRSFDLVLVTEVLEHLPGQVYFEALKELQRVAGRYLLITVPNNETLEANHVKCHDCGDIYHAWTHLRRFAKRDLEILIEGFSLATLRPIGFHVPTLSRWLYVVLQVFGRTWSSSEQALCPSCGIPAHPERPGNWFGSLWQRLIWLLYERIPLQKKAFLAALYRRV
jgi:SAM-dependent methyltransferase